jgi:DNA polymerase III subunit beta
VTTTLTRTAFTVGAKPLASAVQWAAKRVPSRPTVPTLGGILLEVEGGVLTVSGFDETASATAHVEVEDASDGRLLVSGRLLAELLKTFPDKPVAAAEDGAALTLTCGRAEVRLPLMSVEDYPGLLEQAPAIGTVNAAEFAHVVKLVGSSCDVHGEQAVAFLAGVNLRFGEAIGVEATNRYRLAVDEVAWSPLGDTSHVALPPGSHLLAAVDDFAADGGELTVGYEPLGVLSLSTARRSVTLRCLGEPMPDIRRLIPQPVETPARVTVADLKGFAERVRLITDPKDAPVVELAFDGNEMTARGSGLDDKRVTETFDCAYDGEPLTVRFGTRHLIGALSAAGDTEIEMSISNPRQPVLIAPATGGPYRQVVMPMRINA